MRLESQRPTLTTTLHTEPVELRHRAGPYPLEGVTLDELRKAKRAVLHFQGIGLGATAPHISSAQLNQVSVGSLPAAGGAETKGIWADASIRLSPEAIAGLTEWNTLVIENPGGDHFAVRL